MSDKFKQFTTVSHLKLLASMFFCFLVFSLIFWYAAGSSDKWRMIAAIPSPLRKAGKYILREAQDLPYLRYRFDHVELLTYDIRIKAEDLAKLNDNLPKDGEYLGDINTFYVPAKLIYQGKEYKIKIKYRGDTGAHWMYPKKSLRIKFSEEELLDGKRLTNFIIPEDREFFGEELNNYRARKLGMLTPDSGFALVTINGSQPMMYWEIEQMSPEFVETHEVGGDTNLYGDQFLFKQLYSDANYWQKYSVDTRRNQNDSTELVFLLDFLKNSSEQDFNKKIFNIIDENSFYNWSILTMLANSSAQGSQHNMRLYYDWSIGKFKIAVWDIGVNSRWSQGGDSMVFDETDNPLAERILNSPNFLLERNKRLWNYVSQEQNLADDLAYYDLLYAGAKNGFYQDRYKEFSNAYFDARVELIRAVMENQFKKLHDFFDFSLIKCQLVNSNGQYEALLTNPTLLPVSVAGVERIDDSNGQKKPIQLPYNLASKIISPVISTKEIFTDYFIQSGGVDITSFEAFEVFSSTLSIPLGSFSEDSGKNNFVISLKNLYTEEVKDISCTP